MSLIGQVALEILVSLASACTYSLESINGLRKPIMNYSGIHCVSSSLQYDDICDSHCSYFAPINLNLHFNSKIWPLLPPLLTFFVFEKVLQKAFRVLPLQYNLNKKWLWSDFRQCRIYCKSILNIFPLPCWSQLSNDKNTCCSEWCARVLSFASVFLIPCLNFSLISLSEFFIACVVTVVVQFEKKKWKNFLCTAKKDLRITQ